MTRRKSSSPATPPPLLALMEDDGVRRYAPEAVRAATMRQRLARTVAAALRDADADRATIARRMTEFLGEPVSEAVLNRYASQAAEAHDIGAARFAALAHATGDARTVQELLAPLELVAVCASEAAWIRVGKMIDQQEALERRLASAKALARGGRR